MTLEKQHIELLDKLLTSALQKNPKANSAWLDISRSVITEDVKNMARKKGVEIITDLSADWGGVRRIVLKRAS
jgi:hypothetical protein